jgi:formyltetrahydrofolate-dependent phosphoribosylglycinamide formyltransferase
MLNRLQQKWGVSTRQFWILFLVFALTGTTTAIFTRFVTAWLGMDAHSFWLWRVLLRIGMLVFGYQFILLAYGALLGQWSFFWRYEKKLLQKLHLIPTTPNPKPQTPNSKPQTPNLKPLTPNQKNIAIFASGAGSNAEKIIQYLQIHQTIKVRLIVCNKPEAGVLNIAAAHGIPTLLIEKERFFRGDGYLPELKNYSIDFIVLAGFLWKIPAALIAAYPHKMVNIHPALLPAYGGKGMYGMRVHEAVIAAGEKESGITIHYVNEHFDEGEVIFQAKCAVGEGDSAAMLAEKVHGLEHAHFPRVVTHLLEKTI